MNGDPLYEAIEKGMAGHLGGLVPLDVEIGALPIGGCRVQQEKVSAIGIILFITIILARRAAIWIAFVDPQATIPKRVPPAHIVFPADNEKRTWVDKRGEDVEHAFESSKVGQKFSLVKQTLNLLVFIKLHVPTARGQSLLQVGCRRYLLGNLLKIE